MCCINYLQKTHKLGVLVFPIRVTESMLQCTETGYTHTLCVHSGTGPDRIYLIVFIVSSERHRHTGVSEIAKVLKQLQLDLNPGRQD